MNFLVEASPSQMNGLEDLADSILDLIVLFTARDDQFRLAQTNSNFRHVVYSRVYRDLMVSDHATPSRWTKLESCKFDMFASSLSIRTIPFVKNIVINTHTSDNGRAVECLYSKLNSLWSLTDHPLSVIVHDVLSLRNLGPVNEYLDRSSYLITDFEEEVCIVTRKNRKMLNLKNWLFLDPASFLSLPDNAQLRRLGFYIETNDRTSVTSTDLMTNRDITRNLARIEELYLHSPLSFIHFYDLLSRLDMPPLELQKLLLTSSHRARNDAILNFKQINTYIALNSVKELEIKISCTSKHECEDLCMVRFFEDWRIHNEVDDSKANVQKLSLVHYKSLTETSQFKRIVEDYVFSPHFGQLKEVMINLSNLVYTSTSTNSIDMVKVTDNMRFTPNLEVVHMSSFMRECVFYLPQLLDSTLPSYLDVLVNRCDCSVCDRARTSFIRLAELDKLNNYNHRVKLSDIAESGNMKSRVDFSLIANLKFLQYLAKQFRNEEAPMERNLQSTGTMLDMRDMPMQHNLELDIFRKLLAHSCLIEVFDKMKSCAHSLQKVNFGGITIKAHL